MKFLVRLLLICPVVFLACSKPSPGELASLAAKGYYTHLIQGDYDAFLAGKQGADSLPADYRSQLLDTYKQFMSIQQTEHHGIREVRVSNVTTDSLQQHADVFLILCFGDSLNEEVVVPMVEHGGVWQMK